MKQILDSLNELRQLSGNAQLLTLEYRKSDLLKQVLEYTYNPHKKYKIEEGKYNKFRGIIDYNMGYNAQLTIDAWNQFTNMLDCLSEIKSAKDEDVVSISEFIARFNDEGKLFLEQVLFKDLRLNMGIKKFQKVWPDFCVEPQVQLAERLEGQFFENGMYSRKLDGLRCYWKDLTAFSRSNKPHKWEPIVHIQKQLQLLAESEKFIFDGELIYIDENGKEDFQKAISLLRRDDRSVECQNIYYVVFDMIPKERFVNKQPWISFEDEYRCMKDYFQIVEEKLSWYTTSLPNVLIIKQVKEDRRNELEEARNLYNWEGLMYRDGNSPYEYKRTNKLLKIKAMQDIELKLVSMEEGTGKHAGRLGAFIVEFECSTVKIGSGFSDEQRVEYWNNPDKYIGNYVKTQYFERTMNKDGTPSLRFPVFLCFRDIKTSEEFLLK